MVLFDTHDMAFLKHSGHLNIKHHVNGLWNDILHRCFSTALAYKTFTISPEAYPHITHSLGPRADLLVSELVRYHDGSEWDSELSPVLCYEGRGASSSHEFTAIAGKLTSWLEGTSAARKAERSLWAIGAKGSSFKVWVWCMECGFDGQLIPVKLAEDHLPKFLVDGSLDILEPYDIVDNAIQLHELLRYVKEHPHPDVKQMFEDRRSDWVGRWWQRAS